EAGVAVGRMTDEAVDDAVGRVTGLDHRVVERLALGEARERAGFRERPGDAAELQVEAGGVPGRVERDRAVEIGGPFLHHRERLAAAGRTAGEIAALGAFAVALPDQE